MVKTQSNIWFHPLSVCSKSFICATSNYWIRLSFIMYYFTLLFLLAFTTPVLITTSLNVYITSAVSRS